MAGRLQLRSMFRDPVARRQLVVRLLRRIEPLVRTCTIIWRRAALRRVRFVAVVGSYGKTTTMRSLSNALCGSVHRYAANNAGVFVAHGVLRTRPWQRHQVLEVGINGPRQMKRYADMVRPELVVVTSIGSEHRRSLPTLEHTRSEKAKMVEAVPEHGMGFLCGDDPNVLWMRERARCRVVTFGLESHNGVRALDVRSLGPQGMAFRCEAEGFPPLQIETPLLGRPGVYTALATAANVHSSLLPLQALQKPPQSNEWLLPSAWQVQRPFPNQLQSSATL